MPATPLRNFADLPDHARSLIGVPTSGRWTLAQAAEHLALSIDVSLNHFSAGKHKPFRLPRRILGRFFVLTLGVMPLTVSAPDSIVPPADAPLDPALDHLARAVTAFLAHSTPLQPHPLMLFSSKRNWQRFHLTHARHHLSRFA